MKRLIGMLSSVALVLGLACPIAGAAEPIENILMTAQEQDGKIWLTVEIKNVTFNAAQFCVGYDKTKLTPCDVKSGDVAGNALSMVRYEQEPYNRVSAPDGWADYSGNLNVEKGTVEYTVSVTPGASGSEVLNGDGYVVTDEEGLALVSLCFTPTEGEVLYTDSIALAGNNFLPTGIVIATDKLDQYGVVVGITSGSVVRIDLSKVAQPEETPGGGGIEPPPVEEPPVSGGSEDGGGDEPKPEPEKPEPEKPEEQRRSDGIIDIAGNWAEVPIRTLLDEGILTGYTDNTFRPNQNLSRAEFAIIITRIKGLVLWADKPSVFSDCSGYAVPYINAVQEAEYMMGVDDLGNFAPNRNITREEVATVIAKAFELSGDITPNFSDWDEISSWAVQGATAAVGAGIIKGRPEGFAPKANITRAEIAKIVADLI